MWGKTGTRKSPFLPLFTPAARLANKRALHTFSYFIKNVTNTLKSSFILYNWKMAFNTAKFFEIPFSFTKNQMQWQIILNSVYLRTTVFKSQVLLA
jgi:hypothetical protein